MACKCLSTRAGEKDRRARRVTNPRLLPRGHEQAKPQLGIANPLPYSFYPVEKVICRPHGSVRFSHIDTSLPQAS